MVLKLLAKNAEDRYQSSYGLIEDLERCRRELEQRARSSEQRSASDDVSRRFQIPQQLYGRELERTALLALYERAAAGNAEFCMVSGHSGIGKSALVNEISRAIVQHDGYLIQGKFDQFQRSKPYSAVASAFRGLIPQLLVEPEAWRRALLDDLAAAVSPNLGLLVELVPGLNRSLGRSRQFRLCRERRRKTAFRSPSSISSKYRRPQGRWSSSSTTCITATLRR